MVTARTFCYAVGASAAALAFGIVLPIAPVRAVAWLAIILLAFTPPVWMLSAIVAITVLVPYAVQDTFSVIGGQDGPSLVIVDVLVLIGVLRVGWRIVRGRLNVDLPLLVGIFLAALCAVALGAGLAYGASASVAGHEARGAMLGLGAFVIAWPVVNDQTARRRLAGMLIVTGLAVGLWGLAQWIFSVGYTAGDVGVRAPKEVDSRQLQGAMYAYPVAVTLAWAALISGQLRTAVLKWLLAAVLFINAVCVMLTFERTMWLATVVACLFVIVISGAHARFLTLKWAGFALPLLVVAAVVASAEARTVVERVTSAARLGSDNSLKWRVVESHAVADAIAARPLTGSGFGATVTWGLADVFPTTTTHFAHVSPLWLAWKIGLPATAIVVLALVRAVFRRCPSGESQQWLILRRGSRASVLALLIMCAAFPVFNGTGITAAFALLVAISYSRALPSPFRVSSGCPPVFVPHRVGGRDDAG